MILLDGKKVSKEKLSTLKDKTSKLNKKLGLAIIQIADNKESTIYVNKKKQIAQELNYYCQVINFNNNEQEENIIKEIKKLNNDKNIDGIIIELPIPKHFNKDKILNTISKEKDIDGLTKANNILMKNNNPYLIPCTPLAVLDLLDYYNIPLKNKKITIIGKSQLVGTPLSIILNNKNIPNEVLDSKTQNISKITKESDIIIIAIGKKHFLKENMIKENAIIIDVGINKENTKVYGDVDFNNVSKKTSYITPVPGGIGPMTIYEAMNNIYIAYTLKNKKPNSNNFIY